MKFLRKNNLVAQGVFESGINSKITELSSLYMVRVWDWHKSIFGGPPDFGGNNQQTSFQELESLFLS